MSAKGRLVSGLAQDGRMMSDIIEVPLPRAASKRLINFFTFHISIFFSASLACGALIVPEGERRADLADGSLRSAGPSATRYRYRVPRGVQESHNVGNVDADIVLQIPAGE